MIKSVSALPCSGSGSCSGFSALTFGIRDLEHILDFSVFNNDLHMSLIKYYVLGLKEECTYLFATTIACCPVFVGSTGLATVGTTVCNLPSVITAMKVLKKRVSAGEIRERRDDIRHSPYRNHQF
jgi:hypothetical protein